MKLQIHSVLLFGCILGVLLPHLLPGQDTRTGEIAWARLKTDYEHWNRHTNSETLIVEFINDHTDLQIAPQWQVADIDQLDSMTAHPFLYAEAIHPIQSPTHRENLKEYLLRGGFLIIDACINNQVNPDPDLFLTKQVAIMKSLLPEGTLHRIPENSAIFRNFFVIKEGVPHTFHGRIYNEHWDKHGIYAFYYKNRPITIFSMSGLKCGWTFDHGEAHRLTCSKLMVNAYIWAMTR